MVIRLNSFRWQNKMEGFKKADELKWCEHSLLLSLHVSIYHSVVNYRRNSLISLTFDRTLAVRRSPSPPAHPHCILLSFLEKGQMIPADPLIWQGSGKSAFLFLKVPPGEEQKGTTVSFGAHDAIRAFTAFMHTLDRGSILLTISSQKPFFFFFEWEWGKKLAK